VLVGGMLVLSFWVGIWSNGEKIIAYRTEMLGGNHFGVFLFAMNPARTTWK
jgi:hypothetical protein